MSASPAMAQDTRDGFGCSLTGLDHDEQMASAGISFYRKSASLPPRLVTTAAADKGFLVGLSLTGGHSRRIFHEHHSTVHEFEENSVYVRGLAEDYKADLQGRFDFILFEISRSTLQSLADDADAPHVTELLRTNSVPDPTLGGLARALFLAQGMKRTASKLFLDHLAIGIGLHIIGRYGNTQPSIFRGRRTLSKRHESIAKEMIESRYDGDLIVEELALACNLSRSAFLRAFKETTGKTPHQWLNQQRLQRAQDLLLGSAMSLAEISRACGFAEQAHFTRVFSTAIGMPPGAWRRMRQA